MRHAYHASTLPPIDARGVRRAADYPHRVHAAIFLMLVAFEDFPLSIAGLYRSDGRDLRSAP